MLSKHIFALSILLVAACTGAASESKTGQPNERSADKTLKSSSSVSSGNPKIEGKSTSLKSIFTQNFTNVIMRRSRKLAFFPQSNSRAFGMNCTPEYVSNDKQDFEIVLSTNKVDRAHVFVVLTPGGRLYELYSPYGEEVETDDIVIPSQAVSWEIASQTSKFSLKVDDLSGIEVGKDDPIGIFIEEGDYQFALVSSVQKDLIETNRTNPPVTVFAGCIVNFKN